MLKDDLHLFNALVEELIQSEQEHPIVPPVDAAKLHETIDLSLNDAPQLDEAFEQNLRKLVLNTPRTATRLFFNQLFGGRQGKAMLGDLLAVLLNNSMYTYKVAGPQVGVEKALLKKVCEMIGYGPQADGTFAPGGSMTNFMGMLTARDVADADARHEGMNKRMMAYTSKESHYSNAKNAAFAGIGRNNVRYIDTDSKGRIRVDLLEQQIVADQQEGYLPFFINATAGTTVLGAFDPVAEMAAVAQRYNCWLHVDGAYCGAVIFSEQYKHLLNGIDQANSFSFNAHKMLGTPLSCSLIVTQDKKHLHNSFSNDATYLYQTDGDDYNLGKTSLQCGRRNDALKFWTLWKAKGTQGLAQMVEKQFELAQTALAYVQQHPDYQVYSYDDSISVCFNYKGIPADQLCTALYENAALMVGFGTFGEDTFVRLVTINAGNEKQNILDFFTIMEAFVEEHETMFTAAMSS